MVVALKVVMVVMLKTLFGLIRYLPSNASERLRSSFYRRIGLIVGANVRLSVGSLIDVWRKDIYLSIGENVFVGEHTVISGGVKIGKNTSINSNVSICASPPTVIHIGADCLIGQNVVIRADDHRFDDPEQLIRLQGKIGAEIIIEENCWLGANSIVLKGVHLGAHSVVGAGAVVTKSFPAYSVIAGNPAELMKIRKG